MIWAPGDHQLWTHPSDPVQLGGDERYGALVAMCRDAGVVTPEDEYPVWVGEGGQVVAVYGHLHLPRTIECDGVRFEEVSLGYPGEWSKRAGEPDPLRRVLGPPA